MGIVEIHGIGHPSLAEMVTPSGRNIKRYNAIGQKDLGQHIVIEVTARCLFLPQRRKDQWNEGTATLAGEDHQMLNILEQHLATIAARDVIDIVESIFPDDAISRLRRAFFAFHQEPEQSRQSGCRSDRAIQDGLPRTFGKPGDPTIAKD